MEVVHQGSDAEPESGTYGYIPQKVVEQIHSAESDHAGQQKTEGTYGEFAFAGVKSQKAVKRKCRSCMTAWEATCGIPTAPLFFEQTKGVPYFLMIVKEPAHWPGLAENGF